MTSQLYNANSQLYNNIVNLPYELQELIYEKIEYNTILDIFDNYQHYSQEFCNHLFNYILFQIHKKNNLNYLEILYKSTFNLNDFILEDTFSYFDYDNDIGDFKVVSKTYRYLNTNMYIIENKCIKFDGISEINTRSEINNTFRN